MKRTLSALSAASLLLMSSTALAQSVTGSGTADGTLFVSQTVGTVPCNISVPVLTAGGSGSSNTGATSSSPVTLCNVFGNIVSMTDDWDFSYDPVTNEIVIDNVTANAFFGTCGPGQLRGVVMSWGPPLVIYIYYQSISGVPASCFIEGEVTFNGVSLVP